MSWQFDFLLQVLHNFSSEKRTTRDSLNRFLLRPRMISMRGNDGARMEGVFVSSWTDILRGGGIQGHDDSGRNLAQLAK